MLGSSSSTALHKQNLPHPQVANLQLLLACAAAGSLQSALWQACRTSILSGGLTTPAASAFCSSRGAFSKGALLLAVLVHSVLVLLLERVELLLHVRCSSASPLSLSGGCACIRAAMAEARVVHFGMVDGAALAPVWRGLGARCSARYAPEKNQRIKKCITLQDWTLTLHPPKTNQKDVNTSCLHVKSEHWPRALSG